MAEIQVIASGPDRGRAIAVRPDGFQWGRFEHLNNTDGNGAQFLVVRCDPVLFPAEQLLGWSLDIDSCVDVAALSALDGWEVPVVPLSAFSAPMEE